MENETTPCRTITKPIKLKDKNNRGGVRFNLKNVFGFLPEEIIIQKVRDQNNCFLLSAVLTPEELEREKIDIQGKPIVQEGEIVESKKLGGGEK